ncbi:hypothetical protein MRB53_030045 [Persea americana]|uniref:Uncharacterized protein n=1 Tax=Persea americana TaxID=3435 RepID=A0ACC2KKD5_PERAE|nr:hypothetical protein MRB53_030045 [Persea americana]
MTATLTLMTGGICSGGLFREIDGADSSLWVDGWSMGRWCLSAPSPPVQAERPHTHLPAGAREDGAYLAPIYQTPPTQDQRRHPSVPSRWEKLTSVSLPSSPLLPARLLDCLFPSVSPLLPSLSPIHGTPKASFVHTSTNQTLVHRIPLRTHLTPIYYLLRLLDTPPS